MKPLELSPTRKPVRVQKVIKTEIPQDDTPAKEIDLGFDIDPTKVYIFETIAKSTTPRNENLGSSTRAYDPQEKRYRELRYFPTAESIFADEQDESYNEMAPPILGFWRNQLTAAGEDIRLMEYLLNHPLYEHSPFRVMNKPAFFTLADKEVQENIKAKRHETELKALELIKNTPFEDVMPVARIIFGITETSETAIINTLNDIVKKPKQGSEKQSNAEKLIDNIDNVKLLRSYYIQVGIDRGVIAADLNKMRATFVDGNVNICQLSTKNPVKELTDFSFTEDGKRWYTMFRQKV